MSDQRSRLSKHWYNTCLKCGAQGRSMRICRSGFLKRSGALKYGLARMPSGQLWRDWQVRTRTYRILAARQHRGQRNFNPHARGERSRGDGRSSLNPPAPPLPPPVSTRGPSRPSLAYNPLLSTLAFSRRHPCRALPSPVCPSRTTPPIAITSVLFDTRQSPLPDPDAFESTLEVRYGLQTEPNPKGRQPVTFGSR